CGAGAAYLPWAPAGSSVPYAVLITRSVVAPSHRGSHHLLLGFRHVVRLLHRSADTRGAGAADADRTPQTARDGQPRLPRRGRLQRGAVPVPLPAGRHHHPDAVGRTVGLGGGLGDPGGRAAGDGGSGPDRLVGRAGATGGG